LLLPADAPLAPHYVFVPMADCDWLRLRVRFDPSRKPSAVWRVDARAPHTIFAPFEEALFCTDTDGAVELEFSDLRQGRAYGAVWQW